ncbi:methyltransferase domain-containing protein [Nocardioides sp. HDW12B]|uniref:methyltransferase domain-containing protein n=1 Tax=Nocardioides sp. HDW12B TaxID=2714939 RepID=UPI001409A3FD|nr:methyltransferase domain-containing protein [Nocardioides sp. HDW12B]QIK67747.1 methyltransferase domain-containing protein [Nocardioides sp. HDW12B]
MRCEYFEADLCRSCTHLRTPYDEQLTAKQAAVEERLSVPTWLPPVASAEERFRTKAKMVVAGTVEDPTLGILDAAGGGTDLRGCHLHVPAIHDALPRLAAFVTNARLTPYSVPERRGELKHLLLTANRDGRLMLRLVLRSTEALARIRKHLPDLLSDLPLDVVSVNVQPQHAAVLEGEHEELLHGATLPMPVNDLVLPLRPQSFFQTNTDVAAALYRQAREWAGEVAPSSVWDLYCGVGGFARHLAAPGRRVTGVELSEAAVAAAQESAPEDTRFVAGDAVTWVRDQDPADAADLVVVNPPRRGLGPDLCASLEATRPAHLLYSSCNPVSLARDLEAMPGLRPVRGRLFDMFPHTDHAEVLVLLERRT